MRDEQIKKIREACVAANPEIVELKFGCELIAGIQEYICLEEKPRKHYEQVYGVRKNEPTYLTSIHAVGCKVLGRPIRLDDCIAALRKVGYSSTKEWQDTLVHIAENWEPGYLDDQSDALINSVASTLSASV